MIKQVFKWGCWIITIAIMVAIFCLSAQPAEISQNTSNSFAYKVLSIFEEFQRLDESTQSKVVEEMQLYVRKAAHFSEYACLSVFMYLSVLQTFKGKMLFVWSLAVCQLYAVSDEVHQYFVPGRSCEIRDMLIDGAGVISGILAVLLIKIIIFRKRQA